MATIKKQTKKKSSKLNLSDLKTLGHNLLSSRAHINNLPLLLSFIKPSSPPQHALESLLSLQSFFTPILPDLPSSSSSKALLSNGNQSLSKDDPELVYNTWVRSKFEELVKSLIDITVSSKSEDTLKDLAMDAIMEFVKLGKGGKFQSAIYHKFICTIVLSILADDVLLDSLVSKFFKYIDVRYFTYISLEKLARSLETTDGDHISRSRNVELAIHKIHYLLSRIPPLETEEGKSGYEMWSESGFSSRDIDGQKLSGVSHGGGKHGIENTCNDGVLSKSHIAKKMKTKFTKAWTSLLRLSLPLEVYKEVLANLYKVVIPHFSNPVMLCDFLTRSYDIGGVISVMALSGLYILMTEHGLEYPNFYDKLYMLLAPSIFMAKHRSKFFKLLDSCLKSSLLPAYLAAAFTKKLSRLALIVPPSGALVIIALIHNLLRRHPSINHLVHQVTNDESNEDTSRGGTGFSDTVEEYGVDPDSPITKQGVDLFNCEENDPLKSNAMRSSLWEIETLRHHYCPAVSRFVASLENDLTIRAKTAEVDVEDFSSGSYATIFNEEMRRRVKQVPLAVYPTEATPTSLFRESDFPGWTFRFDTTTKQQQSKNKENGAITMSGDDNIKSAKKRRTV